MNQQKIIYSLIFLTLIICGLWIYESNKLPIKLSVCDVSYKNCSVVAEFDEIDSCERSRERASWYCDIVTDPLKPNCRVEKSSISTSFCSK